MKAPANFEAAFDRLFPLAENTARAVVVDPVAAENVAVETMARAYARWHRVGAMGDPTAWVLRTAMTLAEQKGPQEIVDLQAQHRSPHQLLELSLRRAERLKARRKGVIIAAAVALVAVAVGVPIALTAPSSHHVVAGRATTLPPLTTPTFDPTTVAAETTITAAPTTTAVAPATTVGAAATTTSLACRNSSDPKCGAFRWDPAPGANAPLSVSVSMSQQGQTVTFTLHVVDPDGSPIIAGDETCNPPDFGDVGRSRCRPNCPTPGYGPWTPPARQRGDRTVTYTHTYEGSGPYTAYFWFGSVGSPCPKNPYASTVDQPVQVTLS